MQRIYEQKHGSLSENDRLQLACLLIKAGYEVSISRERPPGKNNGKWVWFVEYSGKT